MFRLALYLVYVAHQSTKVIRLTISMLLQRLRSAEPTVEAAIAYNLVDLALAAPEASFIEVVRAFSAINRSANLDDPRYSNNMVRPVNGSFVCFSNSITRS